MSKSKISFHTINKAVGKILNPEPTQPFLKTVIDGAYHVFMTRRDYVLFNEERQMDLIESRS